MKILVTGGTGFIGKKLTEKLLSFGHELWLVTRDSEKARAKFKKWDKKLQWVEGDLSEDSLRDRNLEDIEGVVHLMGESVMQSRWSASVKAQIYKSRVDGTKNLLISLSRSRLKVFISTSAAGIYGDGGNEVLTEDSKIGSGFLAEVCRDWERPVQLARENFKDCRFVIFRMPMVLSSEGGGLPEMLPFFNLGLGGSIGEGLNWMPWIHIDDVIQKYSEALVQQDFSGTYNLCSPNPVQNLHFSKALADALGKHLFLPIPPFMIKLRYGEMAHVLLSSQKMVPSRLISQHGSLRYDTIEEAMENVLGGQD